MSKKITSEQVDKFILNLGTKIHLMEWQKEYIRLILTGETKYKPPVICKELTEQLEPIQKLQGRECDFIIEDEMHELEPVNPNNIKCSKKYKEVKNIQLKFYEEVDNE